jgi:hypothetical protein
MSDKLPEIKNFDDLVFEFRNRDYGAYQIRKKYLSALLTGLLISLLIGCSVVIIPFLGRKQEGMAVYSGG